MTRKILTSVLVAFGLLALALFFYFRSHQMPHQVSHPAPQEHENKVVSTGSIEEDAEQYYRRLLKSRTADTHFAQLEQQVNAKQEYDNQDWYSARYAWKRVIANDPNDFQAWVFFMKTLQALHEDDPDRTDEEELEYVRFLAKKVASSSLDKKVVEQFDNPQDDKVKNRLQALLGVYPQEFGPYFLDIPQQSDKGAACVSWTYPLVHQHDFHYENSILLEPHVKDLGVIARGNQLCLEGLQFGESYRLTFKKGFPGENKAQLSESQALDFYIPHRKPSIRFRERGYILPSFGQQVVPFVAVNVPKVMVRIVHIPERNIQSVKNSWFSNQVSRWEIDNLIEDAGELMWQGYYICESELNKTGISGLPIDKMLGKNLLPGVYVIEARVQSNSYESNEWSTQALIVSDIGLSTYHGPDGLHVMARNLQSAQPMSNVTVNLIAKNNKELGQLKTDEKGWVHFQNALMNGDGGNGPAFLTAAYNDKQFTVFNLRNESFDLSDRGVKGREAIEGVDAYLFTERNLYRPGERVHLVNLLRQADGKAQTQVPLTLKIFRPDGVNAQTVLLQDAGEGGYTYNYDVDGSAPTGQWSAKIYGDPLGNDIGATTFEVHDFVPPRIEVKTTSRDTTIMPLQKHLIDVEATYYFGPKGSDLKVEAESVLVKSQKPFARWQDYHFGLEEEKWAPIRFAQKGTTTDENGQATLETFIESQPQSTLPLAVATNISVFEAGGGRVRAAQNLAQYWYQPFVIGLRGRFKDFHVESNTNVLLDVITLNQEGQLQPKEELTYILYEEQHDFIWFRSGTQWQYEMVTRDRIINSGKLNTNASDTYRLSLPVTSGLYRIEVRDEKTGVASSLRFSAGWVFNQEAPDKPDMLELVHHDNKVDIKSPFEGEVFIGLAGETFKPLYSGKMSSKTMSITIENLDKQLGSGAYLIGTVFRPGEAAKSQMPNRAIGVAWGVDKNVLGQHKINLKMNAPEVVHSNQKVNITINVPEEHPKLRLCAALVDEGTLSLMPFETPNPFDYFFSQRALNVDLRDNYGFLINPFGARPGSFEEGADGSEEGLSSRVLGKLPARSSKIVSLFTDILSANDQKTMSFSFDIPEYTGKLRLMAVAWDENAVGNAQSYVVVRDPVDVYAVLPRFLALNDKVSLPVVLHNTDGESGDYRVALMTDNKTMTQTVKLEKNKESMVFFDVTYSSLGVKTLQLTLQGPHDFTYSRAYELTVRPAGQPMSIQTFGMIAPNQSLRLDSQWTKYWQPDTGSVALSVGALPDFGRKALIKQLIQYPYGCLEQTVSRLVALEYSETSSQEWQKAFGHLSSLQKLDGSFGLWTSVCPQETWLSLYAYDVLLELKRNKINVPSASLESLSSFANELLSRGNSHYTAYAYYVTAKAGKGSLGALRYYAKTQGDIESIQDCAFVGAAFAYYGDVVSAKEWFEKARKGSAQEDVYGSALRDKALLLSLITETTKSDMSPLLAQEVLREMKERHYLSTQEKAWLIRAGTHLALLKTPYTFSVGAEVIKGQDPWQKQWTDVALNKPVILTNKGENNIVYAFSTQGVPKKNAKLPQQGFALSRNIYTLEGVDADAQNLKAGERYMVTLEVIRQNTAKQVLLIDLLPGGFEIEEANLLKGDAFASFSWLQTLTPARFFEGRDDRFVSAYELNNQSKVTAAYIVRAVSKGDFTYPAPFVEAMYQPQYFEYGQAQSIHIE